jgi:hypothetical protein
MECMARRDEARGDDRGERRHIGGRGGSEPSALQLQPPIPVLLVLTGERGEPPPVGDLCHERGEDGPYRVAEAPVKEVGPQGVDGAAIGATEAPDPQGAHEAFEVPLNKSVPPEAGRSAGQAAGRPGPRVPFAEFH